MKRKWIWIALVIVVGLGFYIKKKLSVYYEKVGEISFFNDGQTEIKLVRIFENLPLHFVGNTHQVHCKSPQTAGAPGMPKYFLEPGWRQIPTSLLIFDEREAMNYPTLEVLAERAKKVYFSQGEALVIPHATGIYFSLDRCNSVVNWDILRDLPKDIPVEGNAEVEKCKKQHADDAAKGLQTYGDCRYFSFRNDNRPMFEEISVKEKEIRFQVRSNSLKSPLTVESKDSGKTWTIK